MLIAILFQQISESSGKDDIDVLVQKKYISEALKGRKHKVVEFPVTLDLTALKTFLLKTKPDLCFNLVESIDGSGQYLHFVPAILERMNIPFTGSGSEPLYITTNKILAKERLWAKGIHTPFWTMDLQPLFEPPYIVKPISEDASVEIDEDMVVVEKAKLSSMLKTKNENRAYFVEQYIEGREFNISLLASSDGPVVLPAAEMLFSDYPPEKPHVVGYKAKWDPESFEFNHTIRKFDYPPEDEQLLETITRIARQCWDAFNLRGYARVDFRIDPNGTPWVLEINANPCISPDSGFVAAADQDGLQFVDIVERIMLDSFPLKKHSRYHV